MKYFKLITLLLFLCFAIPLWGQQNKNCDNIVPQYSLPGNSVWALDDSLGMDFNVPSGPAAIETHLNNYSGFRTIASVADSNGQLLFYTHGVNVWLANGSYMQNGSQISGLGNPCQIVQVPYQPGKYYLFTRPGDGLFCNLIDMSANNGMGEVVVTFPLRGVPLVNPLQQILANRIAAIPDCSGNIWVLVHDIESPIFRAFYITASGIDTVPVVSDFSNILPVANYGNGTIGNIAVSPNGKRIALNCSVNNSPYRLTCYDFDAATGALSNPQILKGGEGISFWQAAFSADNSKLYSIASDNNNLLIVQYAFNSTQPDSLVEPDSVGSIIINNNNALSSIGCGLRLGPDGKIYFASHWGYFPDRGQSRFHAVGRINYPNNPASACGFQDSVASVDFSSLPVSGFFYGVFPTETVIPESSLQISVHLQGDTLFAQPNNFDSYQWYYNGNALATGTAAYLSVTDTGLYAVKVVDSSCGCTDSVVYHLSELPDLGIAPLGTNPIRVYPNPTKNKIFVPSPMALNLSLYDLTGRLLLQEKGKKQMDLSTLPDGLYLLKIEDKQGRFIKMEKVVKRK